MIGVGCGAADAVLVLAPLSPVVASPPPPQDAISAKAHMAMARLIFFMLAPKLLDLGNSRQGTGIQG
jgi:hypothetical protein